jgi:transposase InsO family protein/predicted DNA-binding transcriptional regulator AlpA
MTNTRNLSVSEIEAFLKAPKVAEFSAISKNEAYKWIESCLVSSEYWTLKRHQRGIVRKYLSLMTGYSNSQIDRLVDRWRQGGHIVKRDYHKSVFPKKYAREDIILLAETDQVHNFLSGPATASILKREYDFFGNFEYERLSEISASHIYNLRKEFAYQNIVRTFTHTKRAAVSIGERKRPEPNGKHGYVRVDSVHQGDHFEAGKGVYHINMVDEVLQWEIVACVKTISERHLLPVLEIILSLFPFVIIEFHSDNGSEYINRQVAKMLNKLIIKLTKSRPRKSNDNALVETKNGSVIRKEMGYDYIPKSAAGIINEWYEEYLIIYLNYHRPCGYPTLIRNKKGKEKYIYKPKDYMTPYEKLKSLPKAEQYLKPNISFAQLDKIAYSHSDTEFAREMRATKRELFVKVKKCHHGDIQTP